MDAKDLLKNHSVFPFIGAMLESPSLDHSPFPLCAPPSREDDSRIAPTDAHSHRASISPHHGGQTVGAEDAGVRAGEHEFGGAFGGGGADAHAAAGEADREIDIRHIG